MTVVVTGSAGFVGSAVVRLLRERGIESIGIDRAHAPGDGVAADLLDDAPHVDDLLGTADAVIHLAGCPGVRDRDPDVEQRRQRDNVDATSRVLAAVPVNTPIVVASSSSVYGGSDGGRPCREDGPLRARGGYAASKVRAEQLCASRLADGSPLVVARPFTVVGEGQRADMALSRWATAARAGRALHILGSPTRTRDLTDVRHVAHALVALVERGAHGIVNIGTGRGRTLAEMTGALGRALDVEVRLDVHPVGHEEPSDTLADTRRLHRAVGFVPETDLDDVVRRAVAQATRHPQAQAVT